MGCPFASSGCDSLSGNDFWVGCGRNSPSGSSPIPLRHARVPGDGRAILARAGCSLHPAATPALAAPGASLSPRRRIYGPCEGKRDVPCSGTRTALSPRVAGAGADPWLPWESRPQGNGLGSSLLPAALLPALLCRDRGDQTLPGARSRGRRWPETQERLQRWDICCRGWLQLAELAWPSP